MNILVPLPYYSLIFYIAIFIITISVFFQSLNTDIASVDNRVKKQTLGVILLILFILYMGLRPISFWFGDMGNYNFELQSLMQGNPSKENIEPLFALIMFFFASIRSPELFFFFCAFLYIFPLYIVSKRIFGEYWFYCFLMLTSAFTFWTFGVNGIRNGIAGSLFLLAITEKKSIVRYLILIAIVLIHKSLTLPILAYIVSKYIKNMKLYFLFWVLCIPVSLILGSFLETFFLNLGFADENKANVYLGEFDQANELVVLKTGFRWDFLVYSATAVFAAWYYIFQKKVNDVFYKHLVSVYLLSNGFWILIIRANYSNRFAYLSWFMMGIIILYPLLKYQLFKNQHKMVSLIILGFCLFGFLLNVILV